MILVKSKKEDYRSRLKTQITLMFVFTHSDPTFLKTLDGVLIWDAVKCKSKDMTRYSSWQSKAVVGSWFAVENSQLHYWESNMCRQYKFVLSG